VVLKQNLPSVRTGLSSWLPYIEEYWAFCRTIFAVCFAFTYLHACIALYISGLASELAFVRTFHDREILLAFISLISFSSLGGVPVGPIMFTDDANGGLMELIAGSAYDYIPLISLCYTHFERIMEAWG